MWLDQKYISLVSSRLERFHKMGSKGNARFRCPFCGDSSKDEWKTRGYFYHVEDELMFKCHNCGESRGFKRFLKDVAPDLYKEYIFEAFGPKKPKEEHKEPELKMKTPVFNPLSKWESLDKHLNSPAVRYAAKRKLPFEALKRLLWIPDHLEVIKKFAPDRFRPDSKSKEALGIPYFDSVGKPTYLQLRYLEGDLRYQTFTIAEGSPKIWGLERIDPTETVWVTEGALDALFLPNSCAVGDAEVDQAVEILKGLGCSEIILVWDKDWQVNKHVARGVRRAINKGHKVALVEDNFPGKDINEVILNGKTTEWLIEYLHSRVFQGLRAELEFGRLVQYPKS